MQVGKIFDRDDDLRIEEDESLLGDDISTISDN